MKKIITVIPFVALVLVISVFFWQFLLKGALPIPSDTLVGLYHPFRDAYAQSYPRGIPFKNFLITDPIRQQYPWKELAISLEKIGQLPLWNPYNFSGYPLLGNFQSAPFYPLNIFLFFLPFSLGWSILIFLQPLLGGIFLYLYLRNLKLDPWASLLGSIAFIFSGFFISWLLWNTVIQTVIWLPLILLAKDKLLQKWTWRWGIVFFLSECAAVLAGHVQVLFYALCISNAYLFVRILQKSKKTKKLNILVTISKIYLPFLMIGITMFILTTIQWLPTAQSIGLSARSMDQNYLTTAGWFIPWQHLIQFVVPDFFGNPTTLNYWGTWNYAELVGYIGILPLIMALFAMFFRHDKKTYFFTALVVIALLFSLPTPLAILPFALHIPLLSSSQPTRLLFVIDFSLAILGALGLDLFIRKQKGMSIINGTILAIFMGVWVVVLQGSQLFHLSPNQILVTKHNLFFPTIILAITVILINLYRFVQKKRVLKVLLLSLLFFVFIIDVLRFGDKFTPFTNKEYLFPSTPTISFLQKNIGEYRLMTTDSEILPPNVSTYYRLQSVEGYDPLYLKNYAELIAASQRNKADISEPFGFNRIITPHSSPNKTMDLLGVKYVLSLHENTNPSLKKVYEEGETRVYENMNVFPRVFFVKSIERVQTKKAAIEYIMNTTTDLKENAIVLGDIKGKEFIKGTSTIVNYQPNTITIQTNNTGEGFLVLTDVYYPTWHAYIDGQSTTIYPTDYAFRGITVPAGSHTIIFKDTFFSY